MICAVVATRHVTTKRDRRSLMWEGVAPGKNDLGGMGCAKKCKGTVLRLYTGKTVIG